MVRGCAATADSRESLSCESLHRLARHCEIRLEAQRFLPMRARAGHIALRGKNKAHLEVRLDVIRFETYRFSPVCQSLVRFLLIRQHVAQVVMRICEVPDGAKGVCVEL